MALRGGKVKTINNLKKSLKKSSSGSGTIRYIPKDTGIVVRFLTEPTEWIEFFKHFDNAKQTSVGCTDQCGYCAQGERPSKRYLAAVVDVEDGKQVQALELPVTAANALLKKYDKYSTMMDRDYELTREGAGLDTEYDVTPEPPSRMNLKSFEIPDLEQVLEDNLGEGSDEDDEEEERPARRPARKTAKKAPPVKKAARRPTILDEDDEEDDEDAPPRRRISRATAPAKKVARKPIRRTR